jgi:Kdo2-lipid IVA lauroyltransferase/acyltransferase
MNALVFYIFLPIFSLLALMPLRILYFFSDLLYLILYHIIGYRRNIVRQNLKNSFPNQPDDYIIKTEKEFYRHLCDIAVETIKLTTFSGKEISKHCRFSKDSVNMFANLYNSGKNIVIAMGHNGNWEYAGLSMSFHSDYALNFVYRPIKNQYFDQFIYKIRSRFGGKPVPMNQVIKEFYKKSEKPVATAFIADQSAPPESAIWTHFLNQETAVFPGIEKIAGKFNTPVVFAAVYKVSRGIYELKSEILSENPSELKPGELTAKFAKALERQIHTQPGCWLWSHRRWKHKKPSGIVIESTGN